MAGNLKQLARRRQEYTNEKYCQARDGLSATGHRIPIPPATHEQALFEAEILRSVGYGVRPQDPRSGAYQPFGIGAVVLGREGMEIVLGANPGAFLSRIVPIIDGPGVNGIPGLRVRFTSRGAELRDLKTRSKLLLSGMDVELWHRALEAEFEDFWSAKYLGNEPDLHPAERDEISGIRALRSPISELADLLMSGLLRRAHAFRGNGTMKFVDLWCDPMDDEVFIHVEWSGDLSHFEIISRITGKPFGLPFKVSDNICYCDNCTTGTYNITLRDAIDGRIFLRLRRSNLYDDDLPPRPSGPCLLKGPSVAKVSAGARWS